MINAQGVLTQQWADFFDLLVLRAGGAGSASLLASPSGTGIVVQASSTILREITAGSGIGVTNGDGVSGNPSISADVQSVFGRTGAVAAAASDYDASQIDNDSNVPGSTVADALDNLRGIVGEIRMFGQATIPSLWLECDGSAVSRTTYSDLFTAIGTTYGAGDGSTTFNLPDLRGRSPMGKGQGDTAEGGGTGTSRALGDKPGAETHTLTVAEMPSHSHTIFGAVDTASGAASRSLTLSSGNNATSDATGGDGDHNNVSPAAVLAFAIYAGA